jgi:hypothetical protein
LRRGTDAFADHGFALTGSVALLLIDILITWIQFTAEGQLDAPHFLSRLIKHMLSGGFVYLMIANAFSIRDGRSIMRGSINGLHEVQGRS